MIDIVWISEAYTLKHLNIIQDGMLSLFSVHFHNILISINSLIIHKKKLIKQNLLNYEMLFRFNIITLRQKSNFFPVIFWREQVTFG